MENAKNARRGYLGMSVFVGCASFSAVLNRVGVSNGLHPVWLNVFRLAFALVVLWPLLLTRREALASWRAAPRKSKLLTLLSGAMLAAHFGTWTTALSMADSVIVTSIWSASTLFTVLGATLFLHEKTPLTAWLGIGLAVCGTVVAAWGAAGSRFSGLLFSIVTAISYSAYTLCGRRARGDISALCYNTVLYTSATVCLLVVSLVGGIPATGINRGSLLTALALCVICTLGGHSMQNWALGYIKAQTANVISLGEVVTGPLLVFLILGEIPQTRSVVGGAIIVLGVALYILFEERELKHHGKNAGE